MLRSNEVRRPSVACLCRVTAFVSVATAVVTALLPGCVYAAEGTLEEIVVTAQRRAERAQDVPIAITALSSSDIASRGIRQAGDITASVPNFLLSLPYGEEAQPTFALRGVTTNDWGENQSSPIAMYVDDVYKSVGAIQALQAYDLDRIEVLRGPQGTLYGKNATGGAVNFYSKNPSLTEYDGYLTAGVGNFSAYSFNGAIGGPLIDGKLGWRLAVLDSQRDGWVRSVVPGVQPFNGVDAVAGRLSLLYQPSANVTALLKIAVSHSGGTPYGPHSINVDPTVTGFSGDYGWFNNGGKYAIHKSIKHDSVSLKADWQLSEHHTLTSVTGYDYGRWFEKSDDGALAFTDAGVPIHIDDPNTYFSSVNAVSQEIRVASHDAGALNWLAGVYYGRDSTHGSDIFHFYDFCQCNYFFNPATGNSLWGFDSFNSYDQIRESKALFLNLSYAIAPQVTLRAGVRYTRDRISVRKFYALEGGLLSDPTTSILPDQSATLWTQSLPYVNGISYANFSQSFGPQGPTADLDRTDSNISFKAGVDWKLSDNVLTYLTFSQGYRGAAFNSLAFNSPPPIGPRDELTMVKPEKLDSFEIGIKSELMERRLEINAAAFHYNYKNQQFLDLYCAFPTASGCGGTGFITSNAPKSEVTGGEVELRAKPAPALDLRASLGVLDSKYDELFLRFKDRAGNKLIMAPDLSMSVSADWRVAQLAPGDLHVAFDANYYGKQFFDALDTERVAQPAYSIFNARLSLVGRAQQHLSVAAWGKNLFNRQYLSYGLAQRNAEDGGVGLDYALVGEPRTYGLEATYRF